MFNLAIDSKLRGCDLVSLRVDDIAVGGRVRDRATIIQRKTGRPVQFEITEQPRASLQDWLNARPAVRAPTSLPSQFQERLPRGHVCVEDLTLLRQSQSIIDLDPESTGRYLEGGDIRK